jgi:hypothetical protein
MRGRIAVIIAGMLLGSSAWAKVVTRQGFQARAVVRQGSAFARSLRRSDFPPFAVCSRTTGTLDHWTISSNVTRPGGPFVPRKLLVPGEWAGGGSGRRPFPLRFRPSSSTAGSSWTYTATRA